MQNSQYNGKCGFNIQGVSFVFILKPIHLSRSNVLNIEVHEFIGLSQKQDETDWSRNSLVKHRLQFFLFFKWLSHNKRWS